MLREPGATGSAARVRFLDEREGVVMASGVSTSEASWAPAAGARRARVLPLRPEGGILEVCKRCAVVGNQVERMFVALRIDSR